MMTTKVIVFGASGMLGAMVADVLVRDNDLSVTGTVRSPDLARQYGARLPGARWHVLNAETCTLDEIVAMLEGAQWAVNAIGVIKPYIRDDDSAQVERAVRVNALFPHLLMRAVERTGCRVLQIATDCVYSGIQGAYSEQAAHDSLDVYGKSKSLGEVRSSHVHHLRCSIIGPEPKAHVSLLDWFRRQPRGGSVTGYTNHQWNGVTTLHFGRLCAGLINQRLDLPHVQHIVPTGAVSKHELLECFARGYGRDDLTIKLGEAKTVIDRTLATQYPDLNRQVWAAAGYAAPPSVPEMVAELARYDFRLGEN